MIFQRQTKTCDCHFTKATKRLTLSKIILPGNSNFFNWELHSITRTLEKAVHALLSLIRHIDFSSLKPFLACKIFDTMISPILTNNSEVWGLFIKSDFKYWDTSPIEKGHLHFCKRYLQVKNKAFNIACRAELGRYPLMFELI